MFIFILLISIRTITNSLSASCKLLNWQVSIMLMIKGRRRLLLPFHSSDLATGSVSRAQHRLQQQRSRKEKHPHVDGHSIPAITVRPTSR